MKTKLNMCFVAALAAMLITCGIATASPVIPPKSETWSGSTTEGWIVDQGISNNTVSINQSSGSLVAPNGDNNGYLKITLTGDGYVGASGVIRTGSGYSTNFQGSYDHIGPGGEGLIVHFEFQTTNGAPPNALSLYFKSGNDLWAYSGFGAPIANGATTYSAILSPAQEWTYIGGLYNGYNTSAGNTWFNDIGNVDWIGVYVQGLDNGTTTYGLGNFGVDELPVPEPETIWLMMTVILSMVFTFRGRLAQLASQVTVRMNRA